MTTDEFAEKTYRSFSDAFFAALVTAISEASGSSWLLSAVPDAEKTSDESEPVRVNVAVEGTLSGELLLQFRRADAATLAAKCLQPPAAEFGAEQSEALVKFVQAGMGKFSSAVAEEYGAFTSTASIASEPASDGAHVVEMTAADDGGNRVSMSFYLSPMLMEALSLYAAKKSTDETNERSKDTASGKEQNPGTTKPPAGNGRRTKRDPAFRSTPASPARSAGVDQRIRHRTRSPGGGTSRASSRRQGDCPGRSSRHRWQLWASCDRGTATNFHPGAPLIAKEEPKRP